MELPIDRVNNFIHSHDNWEGREEDYVTRTGTYRSEEAVTLYKSDLRDVTQELGEAIDLLTKIDIALDGWAGDLVTEGEALDYIRKLLGNNRS